MFSDIELSVVGWNNGEVMCTIVVLDRQCVLSCLEAERETRSIYKITQVYSNKLLPAPRCIVQHYYLHTDATVRI